MEEERDALKTSDHAPSKRRKWDCAICRLSLTPRGWPAGTTRMCPDSLALSYFLARPNFRPAQPFTRVKQGGDKARCGIINVYAGAALSRLSPLMPDYEKRSSIDPVVATNV